MSRVEEVRKGTEVRRKVYDRLKRRYGMVDRGAAAMSTFLENKIQSGSTKIRWYVGKCVTRRQNNLFQNNQSQLYKELSGAAGQGNSSTPNSVEAREFQASYRLLKRNITGRQDGLAEKELAEVKQQEGVMVQLDDVKAGIKR